MKRSRSFLNYWGFIGLGLSLNSVLQAEDVQSIQPDTEPSVAQNIASMDKDHDGIVTVYEVRSFIESKHGKLYKTQVLDDMESSAAGKSCSTPFAKPLYSY